MNADDIRRYLATPDAADLSADLAASPLRPGDRIAGLVAVALIGRGATCDVWRVHDEATGQDLALKLFRPRESLRRSAHCFSSPPASSPSAARNGKHCPQVQRSDA